MFAARDRGKFLAIVLSAVLDRDFDRVHIERFVVAALASCLSFYRRRLRFGRSWRLRSARGGESNASAEEPGNREERKPAVWIDHSDL